MNKTTHAFLGIEANRRRAKWKQVSIDAEKWTAVYLDEETGRYWELDFIYPESHGGGIPRVRLLGLRETET
ncbi:MAG TPA: hypothetical protein ENK83_08250 [Aliiroseovarius sp.]|nr:hypothetical protein [Aliiroseovarius sp.]